MLPTQAMASLAVVAAPGRLLHAYDEVEEQTWEVGLQGALVHPIHVKLRLIAQCFWACPPLASGRQGTSITCLQVPRPPLSCSSYVGMGTILKRAIMGLLGALCDNSNCRPREDCGG